MNGWVYHGSRRNHHCRPPIGSILHSGNWQGIALCTARMFLFDLEVLLAVARAGDDSVDFAMKVGHGGELTD